jgi:hypothetical protein
VPITYPVPPVTSQAKANRCIHAAVYRICGIEEVLHTNVSTSLVTLTQVSPRARSDVHNVKCNEILLTYQWHSGLQQGHNNPRIQRCTRRCCPVVSRTVVVPFRRDSAKFPRRTRTATGESSCYWALFISTNIFHQHLRQNYVRLRDRATSDGKSYQCNSTLTSLE